MRSRIRSESPSALLRMGTRSLLWTLTTSALGCTVVNGLFVPPSTLDAGGGSEIRSDAGTVAPGGDAASDVSVIGASDGGGSLQDADVADALSLCPITPCPGNEICCYVSKSATSGAYRCMSSCPNGAAPVACAGPQQCTSGAPICCGTLVLGGGVIPNCPAVTMSSSCAASCTTNIALGCNATDTLRLCHDKADCDSNNPNCCSYPGSGLSSFLCVSDLFRKALNLPCAP